MSIYEKIRGFFKKSVGISAFPLQGISRFISPELGQTDFMQQYKKSLYVFACISKIAEKVSSTQFQMYRVMNSTGDVKEVNTHPALDLLYKPNPAQTRMEFLEITEINLKTTGNAFWFKVRDDAGNVKEMWNLRPDMVTVITDTTMLVKSYQYTKPLEGEVVHFDPKDIVHFKYPDPLNQFFGLSPIQACRYRIQTENYATRFQRDFFLNSARPDAVIKQAPNSGMSVTPEQKEQIKKEFESRYRGEGNSSKVAILEGGLEYQLVSISQKEMDFIESMKFTRDDILVVFKVPKPILAIVDDVNRANSETAMAIFLGETIKPEVQRLVDKMNEELMADFGEEFYLDFVDPTPANREQQLNEYQNGLTNGWLLINEVRQKENLPPVTGGWQYYKPFTDAPAGGLDPGVKTLGGPNKKEAYEYEIIPKKYDFKGKYWLKQKFIRYEHVKEMALQEADRIIKERNKLKQHSLLKTPEIKKGYADMVNKAIDSQAKKLSTDTTKFMNEQLDRVLQNFDSKVKAKRMKAISVVKEDIFNKDAEAKMTMEFITPYISEFVNQAGKEALSFTNPKVDFQATEKIRSYIAKRAEQFAKEVNSTTIEGLDATLAEGITAGESVAELRTRVETKYKDFPVYRSDLIARTEATASTNQGMIEGYRQSDVVTGKEWINAGDTRVREEHQDGVGVGGEIIGLDEKFSNGLAFPNEPNCRCVVGPAFLTK